MAGYIKSSKSNDWKTPKETYKELNDEFKFDFDPCPSPRSDWDGLKINWKERNFVNPPYKYLKDWIKKSFEEYKKGKLIVLLIPSRTDTIAFHKYIYPYAELRFLKGRLKFNDGKVSAPFPSVVVIFKGGLK